MSSPVQISDDDESFEEMDQRDIDMVTNIEEIVDISSDATEGYYTSDEGLPAVDLQRSAVIRNLFPTKPVASTSSTNSTSKSTRNAEIPCNPLGGKAGQVSTSSGSMPTAARGPKIEKMIGGVKVVLPVEPYGSQTVLMYKLITAINKCQNCLLESPTGSGKTLALLCGALAWLQQEKGRIALNQANQYVGEYPELSRIDGVADYIASPQKNISPKKLFSTGLGERSIYDKPQNGAGTSHSKRPEPMQNSYCDDKSYNGEVNIHKKRKLNGTPEMGSKSCPSTPDKGISVNQPGTPEEIKFVNQVALVKSRPINNKEAVYVWEMEHFATTLNNHNIGDKQYKGFSNAAEILISNLREMPDRLYGVTQPTGTLVETLNTVLGFVFRESGRFKDDFRPALIRTVSGTGDLPGANTWRNSQFDKWVEKDTLSLRLLCLNPAVVFSGLQTARCIVLASGTLTPLVSLHSELQSAFPLQVSPNHVIPPDRVWIGTLTSCPDGSPLECTSKGTERPIVQDALAQCVLWTCSVTPHGVLCFLPSYSLMNKLYTRWQETGLWHKLNQLKHVFMECRNARDHNDIMEDYYKYVSSSKGALLFAVYRGKVSEGMDFKDHQARAVITVGVPYPNTFDMAVREKMKYNDKYSSQRQLLSSREWLRVQAYRALNQAVGRCVRHRNDWGAVLLVDSRFTQPYYTEHLSKWVRHFLGNNHHSFNSLENSPNGLSTFMKNMKITENEEMGP